ncbi:MAG: SRPBCC family protein [Planctomycetota bacterium]
MPVVELLTEIRAPIERVFDLCRSIDAHVASAQSTGERATGERAVGGRARGLMELGDEVTFSARHLGRRWQLTSRIVAFDRPRYFRDAQVRGVFLRFHHDHYFELRGEMTVVRDVFDWTSPGGVLGRLADAVVVHRHMRAFLTQRMAVLKQLAESEGWRRFLPG